MRTDRSPAARCPPAPWSPAPLAGDPRGIRRGAVAAPPAVRACVLLLLALSWPPQTAAREGDRAQPIDVSAERSEYDERAGTQTLIGNVEISQGSMRINAERVRIELAEARLARIAGSGSPVRFEQEDDAGRAIRAEAREIAYDVAAGTLVLEGAATLSRPGQRLASERIVFDTRTQRVSAEGGDGGRVSIRIDPPAVEEAAPAAEGAR